MLSKETHVDPTESLLKPRTESLVASSDYEKTIRKTTKGT